MNTADAYLRTIFLLDRLEAGRVSTGDLAERLGVAPSTATEMVETLAADGLVDHERYAGVELTDEGRTRARDALQNYCLLQRFLHDVLDVADYHDEAADIERVVDADVADRLLTLVERETTCPECFDPLARECRKLDAPEREERAAGRHYGDG